MAGVAIDANCIARFQRERVFDEVGDGVRAIDHILAHTHIILDDRGLCEHEWLDCIRGPMAENLKDWMAEKLRVGGIIPVKCEPQPNHRRALQQIGFPQKDHKWVCLVVSGHAEAMVTEDIDFYDPARKGCPERATLQIKRGQRGPVARYFRRCLEVPVMMLEHVPDQI